ncbi:MAG: hypothetical protein IT320_14135 [Anaerolineae bacterium]|nr:hypothetical protein [Anaerolineae bacterium]
MRAQILRRHMTIVLFYLALAIVITYPLILNMSSAFIGFEHGDAYENARYIWWFSYALRHGEPLFYQPWLAYPNGLAGVTLQANLLQYFPAWLFAFVMPLAAAHNLQALLTLALNGWTMSLLAHRLTGERRAALVAGAIFMAFPTLQGHLGVAHIGLLVQWPLPLFALMLLKFESSAGERIRTRDMLVAALLFVLAALGHTLQLIWALLPLTIFFALRWIVGRRWVALRRMVIACGLGLLVLGLYLLPTFATTNAYADEGGSVRYSADLLAPFTPSFFHPLFGQWEYTHQVLGINLDEGAAYIGIVGGLLAIVGVWRFRQARVWLALALAAYLFSLGPLLKIFDHPVSFTVDGYSGHIVLPWALVQDWPVFNLVRSPGRFNIGLGLVLAVLVGWGAAWLLGRLRHEWLRWAVALGLIGLILFDYQTFFPLPTTSADIPDAVAQLRERDDVRAVFDVPWDNLISAKSALYLQTAHQHPLIAGQVTRRTPVDPALLTILETTLDPALLDEAGVDLIIAHKGQMDGEALARLATQLGAPFYEDDRFALFDVPEPAATLSFTTVLSTQTAIHDRADSYAYAPGAGWVLLEMTLNADARDFELRLGDEVLAVGTIDAPMRMRIPLPLSGRDYHTLSLAVSPPCPTQIAPGEICRTLNIETFDHGDFVPADFGASLFEHGITLAGRLIAPRADDERQVAAWLWWQFDQPQTENDIRFVHVLDAAGNLVAQQDGSLGDLAAGTARSEEVAIMLPDDLPPGEYQVVAGWYRYPDITPYRLLDDEGGTTVSLGRFTLAETNQPPSASD